MKTFDKELTPLNKEIKLHNGKSDGDVRSYYEAEVDDVRAPFQMIY